MSRSDSKIPLIVTVLVLGYVVFRAVGYVNDYNRSAAAPQSSVIQAEAKQPEQARQLVAEGEQASRASETSGSASQRQFSTETPGANPNSDPNVLYEGPSKTKNKKIWGVVEAGTSTP